MKKIYIEKGNIYSKITNTLSDEVIDAVEDACSFNQEIYDQYSFSKKIKSVSTYNKHTRHFPSGLINRVFGCLDELGYRPVLKDFTDPPIIDIDKMMKKFNDFSLSPRDYQIDGIISGVENNRGLYNWSTGAGKTVLFTSLLLMYDEPSLILVNRKELLKQISSEISKITKRKVGIIGDGVWEPNKWTVAIVNSISKGLNSQSQGVKYRTENFLSKIRFVLGDEVHHLGSSSWTDIMKNIKNAPIRFGFSGTCFHPDSQDVLLAAHTGEIISSVTSDYLISNGWLATPHIYMPDVKAPKNIGNVMGWHDIKNKLIYGNKNIDESGIKFVMSMYNKGLSCIYFSGHDVKYGKRIHDALLDSGVSPRDIAFMSGSENDYKRDVTLNKFKKKEIQILGGTTIYDEGVDVPHTGSGANFGQGYSEISTVQRIGRVLRKTKPEGNLDIDPNDKQRKYYWDPYNMSNGTTEKHSDFRKSIYVRNKTFKLYRRNYGEKK